jgi:hypothetical protein
VKMSFDLNLPQYRYCIPVDNPRPVTAAENSFFSECGTGKGKQKCCRLTMIRYLTGIYLVQFR